ncbi:unnamed protein product [Prorocentrum cordatum]|uniref:Uncharacterized protein n=1 Tax=Prorocentrum cordatum TaxID=2364126 RepID=A0ABN9Q3Z5_9DINO|nr:unnamed protein product [Polarella glacialis]
MAMASPWGCCRASQTVRAHSSTGPRGRLKPANPPLRTGNLVLRAAAAASATCYSGGPTTRGGGRSVVGTNPGGATRQAKGLPTAAVLLKGPLSHRSPRRAGSSSQARECPGSLRPRQQGVNPVDQAERATGNDPTARLASRPPTRGGGAARLWH